MSDFEVSEYEALRATIRERGTVRVCAVLAGIGFWGLLALGTWFSGVQGAPALVPFLILIATFELNFFIHTGVERIGRYIQVFHEEASGTPGWETTAMNFGARFPASADPLFTAIFSIAGAVNLLTSISNRPGRAAWIAVFVLAHIAFAYRIVTARKLAASQRAVDLDRFHSLISK